MEENQFFWDRKKCISQNVLGAVNFVMTFSYILTSWERSAVASLEAGRERTFRGGRPRGKMVLYGGAIDSVVIILQIRATQVLW